MGLDGPEALSSAVHQLGAGSRGCTAETRPATQRHRCRGPAAAGGRNSACRPLLTGRTSIRGWQMLGDDIDNRVGSDGCGNNVLITRTRNRTTTSPRQRSLVCVSAASS